MSSEFVGDDRSLVNQAKLSDLLPLGFHLGHGLAALVKSDYLVKDLRQHLDGQLSIHESHIEGSLETLVLDRKHKVMDEFVKLIIVLIMKLWTASDLIFIVIVCARLLLRHFGDRYLVNFVNCILIHNLYLYWHLI